MRSADPCRRLPFPHPAWLLGLLVLAGPSAGGPGGVRRSGERGLARWQGKAISIRTGSGLRPRPNNSGSEPRPAEPLVVPEWIATARTSPDVQVRLQALDRWGQQGRTGAVDPLMLALNDPDERVRERAQQLIEQDWRAEPVAQGKKNP